MHPSGPLQVISQGRKVEQHVSAAQHLLKSFFQTKNHINFQYLTRKIRHQILVKNGFLKSNHTELQSFTRSSCGR